MESIELLQAAECANNDRREFGIRQDSQLGPIVLGEIFCLKRAPKKEYK